MAAVYQAKKLAELFDVSTWAVYEAVRKQEPPLGTLAIRVGRRIVWPAAPIDRLLGLDEERAGMRRPSAFADPTADPTVDRVLHITRGPVGRVEGPVPS